MLALPVSDHSSHAHRVGTPNTEEAHRFLFCDQLVACNRITIKDVWIGMVLISYYKAKYVHSSYS